MTADLCETFRSLAYRTFDHMGRARRVGHQPLEETFTDTNILELKDRHPADIFCQTFTKAEEGRNGADWEWWLTNSHMTRWLGLRVQAKVLHLQTNSFAHLHYKSGKTGQPKVYQLAKLKSEAKRDGLVPLYCFYLHTPLQPGILKPTRFRLPTPVESLGCSLTTLAHIEGLQKTGESRDFAAVMRGALPWHHLVCRGWHSDDELPESAWALMQEAFEVKEPTQRGRFADGAIEKPAVGIRSIAPAHVRALMEGRTNDAVPAGLGGVLVLRGRRADQPELPAGDWARPTRRPQQP